MLTACHLKIQIELQIFIEKIEIYCFQFFSSRAQFENENKRKSAVFPLSLFCSAPGADASLH